MAKFTLFEIHLDDAQFNPTTAFGGKSDADDLTDEDEYDSEEEEGSLGIPIKPILVVVALLVVALVAKKLMGGGEAEAVEVTPE